MSIDIAELNFLDVETPVLDGSSPDTTVWNDGENGPVAFGATRGSWHWLRLLGAGHYRFPTEPGGPTIRCDVVAQVGARRETVVDCYYRSVVPTILQAYGFETLHGSAVSLPGGVVALCADRETGKSTIAFALQQRGHYAVADDAVVLTVPVAGAVGPVEVQPLPFAMRLRSASAQHFDRPSKHSVLVSEDTERPRPPRTNLAAIVMLARHAGPVTLTRLGASEAFGSVLAQSYAFSLEDGDRKRAMLSRYLRLANLVPTYRLAFPAGLEHLAAICEGVEGLVDAGPTA